MSIRHDDDPCRDARQRATQNRWWLYCDRDRRRGSGQVTAIIEVDVTPSADGPEGTPPVRRVFIAWNEPYDTNELEVVSFVEWVEALGEEEFQALVTDGSMIGLGAQGGTNLAAPV